MEPARASDLSRARGSCTNGDLLDPACQEGAVAVLVHLLRASSWARSDVLSLDEVRCAVLFHALWQSERLAA
jgi:hypothetical protein